MANKIFSALKKIKIHIWILLLITVVGIFLRTYNFRDWLDFRNDQVRDAVLVEEVISGKAPLPLLGPTLKRSGDTKEKLFSVGPIYYYFQIASAKLFGPGPEKMAYPDVFFSILSVPLFYLFLSRYFGKHISLALAGLYALSFFSIVYSRFAWNPNSTPFFVILLLLSLYEFLRYGNKTSWIWVILSGIAIGVGVQLHAILFVLFPLMALAVFIFSMKKDWRVLSKWAVVFLVALLLNLGQLVSETRTGFTNTKFFLNTPVIHEQSKNNLLTSIEDSIGCHFEANAYMLTSIGDEKCYMSLAKLIEGKRSRISNDPLFWTGVSLSFLFSLLGYLYLVYLFWKEKEKDKKHFLGLVIFYLAASFFIMIPVIRADFSDTRYFINVFFVPFMFVGFLFVALSKNKSSLARASLAAAFLFLVVSNLNSIRVLAKELDGQTRSNDHLVILGEAELMVEYIIDNSGGQRAVYFTGDPVHVSNFSKQFSYIADRQKFEFTRSDTALSVPQGKPLFYIDQSPTKKAVTEIDGRGVTGSKNFGQVAIYKLDN